MNFNRQRYAIKIKTNGDAIKLKWPVQGVSILQWMQLQVDGNIEVVSRLNLTNADAIMIINEEGKIENLPDNDLATAIYQSGAEDRIVGDVLLVLQDGDEMFGMDSDQAEEVLDDIYACADQV